MFDGSSKYKGEPFLKSRPCFLPLLYDILLRFRLGPIPITADIKEAIWQIYLAKEHQNFLRLLWFDDIFDIDRSVLVYRLARVFFGLNSSPFSLTRTLKVHLTKLLHQQIYKHFILENF